MQINREGKVTFGDASLNVWEEGLSGGWDERNQWEKSFKREVFARIVQQLNRMGWKCEVPSDMIEQYSLSFARNHRSCSKGDLKGFLDLSGRHIEFSMWQGVNTPNRSDHGGRYEPNKEAVMPYLLRIRMERTRRKLRDYLCNVFAGYEFKTGRNDGRSEKRGPGQLTAVEWVQGCYETSWHFKGDWQAYLKSNPCMGSNRKSADGVMLEHGQRVYGFDRKGRALTGTALYNINNMWWVVTGKYDVRNMACFDLYASPPEDLRRKRNDRLRRRVLEAELAKATANMDYHRAGVVRDLLWPPETELFMVWHEGHSAYHRSNFSGYTESPISAGKFTREECAGWENDQNRVVPVARGAA